MIEWIIAIIFVEALTEILVESELLFPIRDQIHNNNGFLSKLIGCGYCVSVWVAALVAWALPGVISGLLILDLIIKWLALHRLSNWFHEFLVRWFKRIPWTVSLSHTKTDWIINPDINEEPDDV